MPRGADPAQPRSKEKIRRGLQFVALGLKMFREIECAASSARLRGRSFFCFVGKWVCYGWGVRCLCGFFGFFFFFFLLVFFVFFFVFFCCFFFFFFPHEDGAIRRPAPTSVEEGNSSWTRDGDFCRSIRAILGKLWARRPFDLRPIGPVIRTTRRGCGSRAVNLLEACSNTVAVSGQTDIHRRREKDHIKGCLLLQLFEGG